MAIYKNDNGTWYVMIRYRDWTGARKQKCKRGFSTRKEAADWELQFKLQKKASVDMTREVSAGLRIEWSSLSFFRKNEGSGTFCCRSPPSSEFFGT